MQRAGFTCDSPHISRAPSSSVLNDSSQTGITLHQPIKPSSLKAASLQTPSIWQRCMDAFRCPDLVVCLPFGYNTKPIAEPATTQQHKGLDWTDCANYHPTAVHSSVKPLTSDLRPNIPNCLRASTNKRFHQNTPLLQIYSIAADITTAHYTHNQLRYTLAAIPIPPRAPNQNRATPG